MKNILFAAAFALPLACCSLSKQTANADLSVTLDAASVAESAYAAQPGANPKTVQTLTRLLAAAQAAVQTWESSTQPSDQAAAAAAIAALVEYESAAGITL